MWKQYYFFKAKEITKFALGKLRSPYKFTLSILTTPHMDLLVVFSMVLIIQKDLNHIFGFSRSFVVPILPNAFHWCSICILYVHIYLWSKVVCLFCFVPMRSTEVGCFRLHTSYVWKALKERGAWVWFHGVWTCNVEVF